MKIFYYQLSEYLNNSLSSLYIISGSEPLVDMEVCDMVRAKLNSLGRVERKVINIEKEKSWCKKLLEVSTNLSLFYILKLIEIQTHSTPNIQYAKLLMSTNIFLLIRTMRTLDIQQKNWFKELECVFVPIFKIEDIYGWIFNRAAKKHQISLDIDAIYFLKQRYESNLLALDQALANIKLKYPNNTFLKAQDILTTISDNSRFNVIDLLDACILGDTNRCIHIIQVLQISDFDVSIILWNLIIELRILSKKTKHKLSLQRLSIYSIHNMLLFAQKLDIANKNEDKDNIWVSLNNLTFMLF
ncbi:DNA polymerase III subunit delta [Candidatus Portiera aleyrodidarum]|uniref:DNA polymerase III subunit delta n=1 Tax=Candidatus Portiera aleyrodidarum TaxID=91844 RepID=A0A6S6RS46_9GAMM|nr:DNA polymerase III subunit delta [Candidatus Portiera aleyrodidarum]CAA3705535.1 DNA polymerase III subunit delta [Candidatus Portiera aleyrodidarum]